MGCYKTGIIPAAGMATRFGGLMKELLPLPDGRSLLEHAIERLSFCDRIVIVTSDAKTKEHQRYVGGKVQLIPQFGQGMWSAIKSAYTMYHADQYYMTMPDTWIAPDCFAGVPETAFAYGYFLTDTPERFGCLCQDKFVDKSGDIPTPAVAWGVLSWSRSACDLWERTRAADYTSAINVALAEFTTRHWNIGAYFDCANMDAYMLLLDHLRRDL